jgi:hypothetical protein
VAAPGIVVCACDFLVPLVNHFVEQHIFEEQAQALRVAAAVLQVA